MPAASSGASRPLSAASTASLRTAVIRTLIEMDPSPRASREMRHEFTVALLKPERGSWPNQSMNSSSPRLYTRRVIGERWNDKIECHADELPRYAQVWSSL